MTTDTPSIEGIEFIQCVRDNGSVSLWKARQTTLDRIVTVRILYGADAANPALRNDFVGTSRILAQLHNEGIIEVYDISDSVANPYMVAEWADGPTVAEAVANAHGPLPVRASLATASQIATALDSAWNEKRLLFRNLKPTEIRLAKEQAKIVNFGLAVAVPQGSDFFNSNGEIVGTPHFSAPEQLQGLPIDFRAEMFSLGATLYLMLTGHPPYEQMMPEQILTAAKPGCIVNPRDLNPKVTTAMANLVAKLMMRDPRDRYASWKDFRADVASILAGKPAPRLSSMQLEGSMIAAPVNNPAPAESNANAAGKFESAANEAHGHGGSFFHGLLWLILAAWIVVLGNDRLGNPLGLPFTIFGESVNASSDIVSETAPVPATIGESEPSQSVNEYGWTTSAEPAAPKSYAEMVSQNQTAPSQDEEIAIPDEAAKALAAAILDGGAQAALSALDKIGLDAKAAGELRDALSAIPDSNEMVMDTLLDRQGEVVTIIYMDKERNIKPLRGVNGVLDTEFIVDGQPPRQVSFPIAKLSAAERLRWMPTPDGEEEQVAYCLLAIQAGKRSVAMSHAVECGPLAPVIKAAAATIESAETEE